MTEQAEKWETIKCKNCNGDGFTAEHSDFHSPEDGTCIECPVKQQCADCHAEGSYMTLDAVRSLLTAERNRVLDEVIEMFKREQKIGETYEFSLAINYSKSILAQLNQLKSE